MDRRAFAKLAFGGIALAALPRAAARAATQPPSFAGKPYARLLERAVAAFDANPGILRDRVALADFSVASSDHRFHIVDLAAGQATSYLVAHGRGSDPAHSGWLQSFSNEPGSLATSGGAYRTGDIYSGIHGMAMRLNGLEWRNNNAEMRAIVIHGADYATENHVAAWGKLGRSEGCFVVPPHLMPQLLNILGPNRLLYADKMV